MANVLVTPTWVMKEIGRRLVNNLKFANNVNRSYSDEYVVQGAKVGYTVNARLPQRYRVSKGQALNISNVIDAVVPITLTDQAHIGIEFGTASLTMEVNSYKDRYIAPAVDSLVNAVDFDGLQRMYQSVFMSVGAPGTIPGSSGTNPTAANIVYLGAGVKLSNAAVPVDGRVAILSPEMHAYLAIANATLFNPASAISEQYKSGMFASKALGIDEWFMSQNVCTHSTGTITGTPTVTTAPTEGATTVVTGAWASAAASHPVKGDVVQFAGCYAINPLSYQSTGQLQDFVVTATPTNDASGNVTIPVYPAFKVTGDDATCSAFPAATAAVTTFGAVNTYSLKTSPQGLVYHPDAFALVMADLEMPGGLWVSERISSKTLGISVRFLKDYNVMTDQSPARVDLLYGWKAVRPELACRVAG